VAQLTAESDPKFSVYSVVSSSFFWPYPHTEQSDFLFGQALSGTGDEKYISKRLSTVFSTDNFARLDVNLTELRVSFFERKGDLLGKVIKLPL
jgi:alkaline phosphatase D